MCVWFFFFQLTGDSNLNAALQQQLLDQFRKDNEALVENLEMRKNKALEDTKVGPKWRSSPFC